MTCLKASEAGVDIVDASLAPFALRSGPPAVEPIAVALQDTSRDTGLNLAHLLTLGEHLESVAPKYRDFQGRTAMSVVDTSVLAHQVPGGMISNLVSQLRQSSALHRLSEVYEEIPRVRRELGYPPLVTPISQMIGVQAVHNVILGRYKLVSTQLMDYCYGLYGRSPAPIDADVQATILKHYPRGTTPVTCRPADMIDPELDQAREAVRDLTDDTGDVLTAALYPTTGMRFLRWKHGVEAPPPEVKPKVLETSGAKTNSSPR
jgi:pyruvate carboxylase subunit B